MQRDRDNDRVKQHDPQREREADLQRDEQRSSTRGVRPWAHETTAWLSRPNQAEHARALPPRDLGERLQRDVDALRSIGGLKPESWAKANPDERLVMLREVEATLATAQGRAGFRVYVADSTRLPGMLAASKIPDRPVDEKNANLQREVTSKHAFVDAENHLILVRDKLLDPTAEWLERNFNNLHEALDVFLEECRHCYQTAVLDYPNRYSEVDALTFSLWQDGKSKYDEDFQSEDWSRYNNNELEKDAKSYATEAVRRLREGDEGT